MQAKTTVENLAVKDAMGDYVGRFANCHNRPTAPDGTKITPAPLDYNWLNNDLALARWYNKVANSIFKSINVIAATLYGHYDGDAQLLCEQGNKRICRIFQCRDKGFQGDFERSCGYKVLHV